MTSLKEIEARAEEIIDVLPDLIIVANRDIFLLIKAVQQLGFIKRALHDEADTKKARRACLTLDHDVLALLEDE